MTLKLKPVCRICQYGTGQIVEFRVSQIGVIMAHVKCAKAIKLGYPEMKVVRVKKL